MDETANAVDQMVGSINSLVEAGPLALAILVVIMVIVVATLSSRDKASEAKADGETIGELRNITKELVSLGGTIQNGMNGQKQLIEDTHLTTSLLLDRQDKLLKGIRYRQKLMVRSDAHLVQVIEQIPSMFEVAIRQSIIEFTGVLSSERAAALNESLFEFPGKEDCRWKDAFIKSGIQDVTINVYRVPAFQDNNILTTVAPTGETCRIIVNPSIAGWSIVRLPRLDSDQPMQGWIFKKSADITLGITKSEISDTV